MEKSCLNTIQCKVKPGVWPEVLIIWLFSGFRSKNKYCPSSAASYPRIYRSLTKHLKCTRTNKCEDQIEISFKGWFCLLSFLSKHQRYILNSFIQYSELWFTIPQWLTSSKIEALTFTAWILRTTKCTSPLNNILCPKPLGMIFIWSHLKIEFRVCGFLFRPLFLNMMHKYFWIHRTPQIRFKRTSFCQKKRRQNGLQCPYCGIDVIPRITLSLSFELKQKRSKLFLKLKSSYF